MTATVHYMPPLRADLLKRRINAMLEDAADIAHEGQFDIAERLVERARQELQQRKSA